MSEMEERKEEEGGSAGTECSENTQNISKVSLHHLPDLDLNGFLHYLYLSY